MSVVEPQGDLSFRVAETFFFPRTQPLEPCVNSFSQTAWVCGAFTAYMDGNATDVYYWMFKYIYEIHVHTNMKSIPIHIMLVMNAYTIVNNLRIHINLTHAYTYRHSLTHINWIHAYTPTKTHAHTYELAACRHTYTYSHIHINLIHAYTPINTRTYI